MLSLIWQEVKTHVYYQVGPRKNQPSIDLVYANLLLKNKIQQLCISIPLSYSMFGVWCHRQTDSFVARFCGVSLSVIVFH